MLPQILPGAQPPTENSRQDFSETFTAGGYFVVPNWHADRLLPLLSPVEWAVLSIALRQTVGWQRRRDAIALSQFYARVYAGRRAIREALDALTGFGVLIRTEHTGRPPVYEVQADAGAVDWMGLADRRNSWDAETNRRTVAGRKAAARARGDIFADASTVADFGGNAGGGTAGEIPHPCHHTAPPPLPSHGRGTPAVITAHTKTNHRNEKQEEGKALPPAPAFVCDRGNAETNTSRQADRPKSPGMVKPASPTPPAPATNSKNRGEFLPRVGQSPAANAGAVPAPVVSSDSPPLSPCPPASPTAPTSPPAAADAPAPSFAPTATPLADAFDRERHAILARAGVQAVQIPRADRPGIEAQLAAGGVTVADVPALVAWIAAHSWPRRRDLLRHAGPIAAEKVAVPLLADWRNETGVGVVPRIEPTATEGQAVTDDPAEAARRTRYLEALAAGRRDDAARCDAGIFQTDVYRWRREVSGFADAERKAFSGKTRAISPDSRQ